MKKSEKTVQNITLEDMQNIFLDQICMESLEIKAGVSRKEEDAYYDAFDMLDDVFDQKTKAKRIAGAKKVLEKSPYVVDAMLILIEEEMTSAPQKIEACQEAIKLGKKFIGKQALKEFEGELWMHIPARPMMRALHSLAILYADNRQERDALKIYEEMLALNQNDNQGIRYECLPLMIRMGDMENAKGLHEKYKDDWLSMWVYMGALLSFKKGKPNKTAEKLLLEAYSLNPHFAPFLTGEQKIPKSHMADYYSRGDLSEALVFIDDIYISYQSVDGALDWAAGILKK